MCGISGILGPGARESTIKLMVAVQRHRGPDDEGWWVDADAHIALGHNRLSIIDVSRAGHQPMWSPCGRYALTFNGEIYNYKELRETLKPYPFRSNSDSEVLLAAYAKWGPDCLTHFIGMYGFAVWDEVDRKLFCARDRFGIKPFYYATDKSGFLFASEIKAVLAAGVALKPNWGAWGDYLNFGLYDHSNETFFAGIRSLDPGHYLLLSNGQQPKPQRYWRLEPKAEPVSLPDGEAGARFRHALQDSVRLHLRSDVPLGINLSGGADSSALCMLIDADADASQSLSTFTVGYGSERYDELVHADAVPTKLNWVRNEIKFSADECVPMLERAIWHHEAPIGGVATLAYQKLHQEAAAQGIKVLLEGQGMDEILAGYGYYRFLTGHGLNGHGTTTRSADGIPLFYQDNSKFLAPELLLENSPLTLSGTTNFAEPFRTPLENAMYADLMHRRVPRVLRMNDRLSMAHGIELREPFLDHRLAELAFRLPLHQKLRDGKGKYLLRACLSNGETASQAIWQDKRGVTTPQREWLRRELSEYTNSVISSRAFAELGLFDVKAVRNEYARYVREGAENSFYIWQWLNVALWFERFIGRDRDVSLRNAITQPVA